MNPPRPLDPRIREFVRALARDLARRDFYRSKPEHAEEYARWLKLRQPPGRRSEH